MPVPASAKMLVIIDLNRYFAFQGQTENARTDIFLSPSITGTAIAGFKLGQRRFITDDMQNIPVFIGYVYCKTGTADKLI